MSITLDPSDAALRHAWRHRDYNPADHWPGEPDRGIDSDAESWRCECGRWVSFWDVMVMTPVTCIDCWLQTRSEARCGDA